MTEQPEARSLHLATGRTEAAVQEPRGTLGTCLQGKAASGQGASERQQGKEKPPAATKPSGKLLVTPGLSVQENLLSLTS